MKILLVKTSSLGDVIHNLPVVSDIRRKFPQARIDWVVEENFAAVPALHPGVRNVLPVAVRRWRRNLWGGGTWHEMHAFKELLQAETYDCVIDTQGLVKSALIAGLARGVRCGYDKASARESFAARFYQRTYVVPSMQHAVERNRQLAAQALAYQVEGGPDYGIVVDVVAPAWLPPQPYAVLLHASSGDYKLWHEESWVELGGQFARRGWACVLPWGSTAERERSTRLAGKIPGAVVAPQLDLRAVAGLLAGARAVVGVDTGLTHLAAALGVATAGIYCATNPAATGIYGAARAANLGGIGYMPQVQQVLAVLERLGA
ncbi:MAG: lipopolysaccharide heptosyltransferase I [Pseudomonadota bacterium]